MSQVLCFGDSITYGARDTEGGGWATRLRKHLDEKRDADSNFYVIAYNLGVPGENSDGLRARFLEETKARVASLGDEAVLFLIAIGANDACFTPSKGEFRVTKERYRENLKDIFANAQQFSENVIALTITPVVDELAGVPENQDKSRLNTYVDQYNVVLKEVAAEMSVTIIDVHKAFMEIDHTTDFSSDGVHPNSMGHELIFNQVYNYLRK